MRCFVSTCSLCRSLGRSLCRSFIRATRLVTYADPAIAEAAIEQLNNADLGGRPIHIRLDRKEVEASGGFPGESCLYLFSVGLPCLPQAAT